MTQLKAAMLSPAGCPDLEDLAAFLDGTLSMDVRTRIVEHLASCEDCFEIFAGAARFQEDDQASAAAPGEPSAERDRESGDSGQPRPFDRRWQRLIPSSAPQAWRAPMAALAALLLVAIGLAIFQGARSQPRIEPEGLAADLVRNPEVVKEVPWSRPKRGEPGDTEVPPDRQAFQLGVRLLDIRLALAAGTKDQADSALQRMVAVLGRMDFKPAETLAAYQGMRQKVEHGVSPRSLLPEAVKAEKSKDLAEAAEPDFISLGSWTEACRLQGLIGKTGRTGKTDLFRSRSTRQFLDRMLDRKPEEGTLDPQATAIVRGIRQAIESLPAVADGAAPAQLADRCQTLLLHLDSE